MLSTVSNYGVDSYIHYKALQGGIELVQQTEATEKGFAELITSLREQQQNSAKSEPHNWVKSF